MPFFWGDSAASILVVVLLEFDVDDVFARLSRLLRSGVQVRIGLGPCSGRCFHRKTYADPFHEIALEDSAEGRRQ